MARDDNPFTRKRHESEPEPTTHSHDYDLSSVAVAFMNVVKAIPQAREVRELRHGVKRALREAADRL